MRLASLLFLLPLSLVTQIGAQTAGAVQTLPAPAPAQVIAPAGAPASESKPEDLASIAGQVADAATGEPLRKVNVVLRSSDLNPNGGVPRSYGGSSDSGGKFVINGVEPGRYRLTMSHAGYANGEYGSTSPGRPGTIVSLGRAQKLTDLTVRMTPHGVVTGRIVDRDGDPLTGVTVQLMRYMYVNGRRQLSYANGSSTNDLGEYRIFGIAPGRYYVSATYRENQFDPLRSNASDEDYATTYYPGTADVSTAAEINATAGGQARIDLTLTKTRARSF
jgi:hypothetical protein